MNKDISTLHKLPRGRAWRSRLNVYADDIARWRAQGESYAQIVRILTERGVKISLSAVHAFVRVRASQRQPQYMLPKTAHEDRATESSPDTQDDVPSETSFKALCSSNSQPPLVRYVPPERKPSKFQPGALAINDPFK